MNYLKNAWYPVAWLNEIPENGSLARTILDIPMIFFRDEDGKVAALEDTCPHRAAPLSMGKLENCVLQCPYHGLKFNSKGDCVHNPQGRVSPRAKVPTFPTLEKYCALWIWAGDESKADPELIPEFDYMNEEHWAVGKGYLFIEGNYELESDNILDLSHIEFLHPLFSSPQVSQAKAVYEEDGQTVWSKRDMDNDENVPDFVKQGHMVPPDAKAVDRWLHVRWNAPALMALWSGAIASGMPKDQAIVSPSIHWFTPESEYKSHYFFSACIPKMMGDAAQVIADDIIVKLGDVFEREDKPMIEAQQKRLGTTRLEEKSKVFMPGDGGGVAARRILKSLIDKESKAS